jgi:hypothetical protein
MIGPNPARSPPAGSQTSTGTVSKKSLVPLRGTDGSNPLPSSSESSANRAASAFFEENGPLGGSLALPGVDCVVTSEDARRWTRPFAVAVKTPMEQWCLAMDRVRYVRTQSHPSIGPTAIDARFAADSLLEGDGFEPSVPRREARLIIRIRDSKPSPSSEESGANLAELVSVWCAMFHQ